MGEREIEAIRTAVPEFEPDLQRRLRDEEGEVGPFEVVRGHELVRQLGAGTASRASRRGAVRRAFDAVERLIVDTSFQMGDALAAEFIEVTWRDSEALDLMKPMTRARVSD